MWQEVEKLEPLVVDFVCLFSDSVTVKPVFHSLDAGDPAVGIAVEVETHVSEDNV